MGCNSGGCRCLLWLLAVFCLIHLSWESCWLARKCCNGKDSSCSTFGVTIRGRTGKCFCDEHCNLTSDCCRDYFETCQYYAIDCQVSEWSGWTRCSRECGYGFKSRSRYVIRQAQHGGNACPNLNQKTVCFQSNCRNPRAIGSNRKLREVASILPYSYGHWRTNANFHPGKDVRRNLFNHYRDFKISYIQRENYCAEFEIVTTGPGCMNSYWARSALQPRRRICVECQRNAMHHYLGQRCRGDGLFQQETRWLAVNVKECSGQWTQRTTHRPCTCNKGSGLDFVFV